MERGNGRGESERSRRGNEKREQLRDSNPRGNRGRGLRGVEDRRYLEEQEDKKKKRLKEKREAEKKAQKVLNKADNRSNLSGKKTSKELEAERIIHGREGNKVTDKVSELLGEERSANGDKYKHGVFERYKDGKEIANAVTGKSTADYIKNSGKNILKMNPFSFDSVKRGTENIVNDGVKEGINRVTYGGGTVAEKVNKYGRRKRTKDGRIQYTKANKNTKMLIWAISIGVFCFMWLLILLFLFILVVAGGYFATNGSKSSSSSEETVSTSNEAKSDDAKSDDDIKFSGDISEDLQKKYAKVIEEAKKVQGVPYVWGKALANGMDCSGLVTYAYNKAGLETPRYSAAQFYNNSVIMDEKDAQPGDMIFFRGMPTKNNGNKDSRKLYGKARKSDMVTHIGLYMGNGKVIHTIPNGGVQISDMNDGTGSWMTYYYPEYGRLKTYAK